METRYRQAIWKARFDPTRDWASSSIPRSKRATYCLRIKEVDRMVAARFDLPAEKVENRKLTLHVEDATGAEFVFTK